MSERTHSHAASRADIGTASGWLLRLAPTAATATLLEEHLQVLRTVDFRPEDVQKKQWRRWPIDPDLPRRKTGLSVYLGIMRCLREAVRLKRPERWQNNDWILHVGIARPHTAHVVLQFLAKHSTIQIPHPPYSPDLAPNDFFLYPKLKMNLKGRKFDNVDMIQAESKATLRNLSKSDFISCFDNWKKRWNGEIILENPFNGRHAPSDGSSGRQPCPLRSGITDVISSAQRQRIFSSLQTLPTDNIS
ncbi:hypothetical protein LAZ67_9000110 [Cordylochernes scorpioides]|uniref:Transposase n=1 Tax=Cordylochernes scorpioides TaxID=51811 RepID=A0ABY6KS89_9ARAC|nr:hypothetical protein LAZ67_9000110 [Cordylochernes scorpioides]